MTAPPPHGRWAWTARNVAALIVLTGLLAGVIGWRMLDRRGRMTADLAVIDTAMPAADEKIDPNTASWASMARLPGIGPGRAKEICRYRGKLDVGPAFTRAEDLQQVKGIGPIIVDGIRPYLTFAEPTNDRPARVRSGG